MFDYLLPTTVAEACGYLAAHPQAQPLLGGTDLLVQLRNGKRQADCLVDLKAIPELAGITATDDGGVALGARVTLNEILASPLVAERYPVLTDALRRVAAYPVRNRATLAGNLVNASPAADSAPPLLVLDAAVELSGPAGSRTVPLAEFFLGPGRTALQPGEILTKVLIPGTFATWPGAYGRQARRRALDLAIVGVAVLGGPPRPGGPVSWRLAACAVAPTPVRLRAAEAERGAGLPDDARLLRAAALAAAEVHPLSDVRSSEEYRRSMVELHLRRTVQAVRQQLEG